MVIKFDWENVVLSGGSFQNNILYKSVRDRLEKLGLKVFRNRQVPMNDNGIALGQIAYVLRRSDNVFGIPMLIEKIQDNKAVASFMNVRREIRIDVVPEVKPGDYVMVHAGMAIEILNQEEHRKHWKCGRNWVMRTFSSDNPATIMEVCGTHTHELFRTGIRLPYLTG